MRVLLLLVSTVRPRTPVLTPSTAVAVADGGGWSVICATASTPTGPLTYSFYFATSSAPVSVDQTSDTYSIAAVTLADAGEYKCTATVGGVESDQSAAVTLTGRR